MLSSIERGLVEIKTVEVVLFKGVGVAGCVLGLESF